MNLRYLRKSIVVTLLISSTPISVPSQGREVYDSRQQQLQQSPIRSSQSDSEPSKDALPEQQPEADAAKQAKMSQSQVPQSLTPTSTQLTLDTLKLQEAIEEKFTILNSFGLTGRMAFTASLDIGESILVADFDDNKVRFLVGGSGNNFYPVLSPDGGTIALLSDRDGNQEIYLTDWLGRSVRRLTNTPHNEEQIAWLTDGSAVVASQTSNKDKNAISRLVAFNVENGSFQIIAQLRGKVLTPTAHPNGEVLAYATNKRWPNWDICFWHLIPRREECPFASSKLLGRPKFSHNGKLLAMSAGDGNSMALAIHEVGTESFNIISDSEGGKHYDAEWLGNDHFIAFASTPAGKNIFAIRIINVQSGDISPLLRSPVSVRYPSWSPVKTFDLEVRRIQAEGE